MKLTLLNLLFIFGITPNGNCVEIKHVPLRISATLMDLGQVKPIYMVGNFGTVIRLPGNITDAFPGDPDSVLIHKQGNQSNEVRISLANGHATATNLFVWTGTKKYIFDIVPSKSIHQDSVEVSGDFGGAQFTGQALKLMDSSSQTGAKK